MSVGVSLNKYGKLFAGFTGNNCVFQFHRGQHSDNFFVSLIMACMGFLVTLLAFWPASACELARWNYKFDYMTTSSVGSNTGL